VFSSFIEALTSLVKCNMTAEVFRSLALFITYAYHKPISSGARTPLNQAGTLPTRFSISSNGPRRPTLSTFSDGKELASTTLSKRQLGNKVLEMYSNLLCEKDNSTNIRKFARTVTNKVDLRNIVKIGHANMMTQWLLHLLTEDDPEVVVHASKIMARLLVIHGSGYVSKFSGKTGGFTIMRHRLKRWWDLPPLWPICFSILFARDVADIDFERSFELFSLLEAFGNCKVVYPNILPVITSMLQSGLKDVFRHQDDPDSPLSEKGNGKQPETALSVPSVPSRRRSMSLTKELESRREYFWSTPDELHTN